MFVIANLEGTPLQWARDIFLNEKHPYRKSYETFKKALYSLYDNHTYHQDAEEKLLSLEEMKFAAAYAVEFETLVAPLSWNNAAFCAQFFKKN